ncbi:hypothetical protein EMCRGX_G025561 [Ephydatia muelleri]
MDIDGPEAKRCKRRGPKWPLLDLGLFSWFSSVRERNGVLSDALLLTKAAELAEELGIRLSTSSWNPNSSHHQSVPVTSTPSSSQPVAAPPNVSSQPVAAPPNVSSQPVAATPPVNRQPVAAPPTVSSQPVAAPPPVNRQPVIMTAIPPVSHQPVAATPPVNHQPVAATPPVNHQPVAATPPVNHQPVAATPPVNHQPVAATPQVNHQLVAATPPVNHQPVAATPPVNHQPVAATPQVNHQLVTATPQVNHQPVTATPPVNHQLVTATAQVNHQLVTATPQVNHQPVTATPQISRQSMTATPTISSQPVAATPTVSSRQLSPTASSNNDLTVDGQLILSNGWLSRWKGRHGVFSVQLHGEAGGADQQGVARAQRELPGIIEKYRPEDVFNIDETGLFYRQAPDCTLTTTADERGAKKAKDCITVALAVNVTASEQLKPVVIHKYKKPRCFGRTFNPNSLVMYYSNTNAWMHTDQVNEQFKQQNRQCLMLLDNASSHILSDTPMIKVGSFDCFKLSNLLLLFFPANCTSVVQPLDQGVIAALKARYKSKLATHMVTQYDIDPTQDLRALSSKTNVKEAIIWLLAAWGEITLSTIVNCWCTAGILPAEWCRLLRPDRAAVAVEEATEGAQLTAITTAIQRLPVENGTTRMSATEWVNAPGEVEIEGAETIAQIAARLLGRDNEDRDDESDGQADPNNAETRTVPLEEAKRSALSLAQFRLGALHQATANDVAQILEGMEEVADKVAAASSIERVKTTSPRSKELLDQAARDLPEGCLFIARAWPLLSNLEDPELRRLAQALPATVLSSIRADSTPQVPTSNGRPGPTLKQGVPSLPVQELHLVLYLSESTESKAAE